MTQTTSDLETYRRDERMQLLNVGFDRLRSNEDAWNEELKDREELEGTLNDGL